MSGIMTDQEIFGGDRAILLIRQAETPREAIQLLEAELAECPGWAERREFESGVIAALVLEHFRARDLAEVLVAANRGR